MNGKVSRMGKLWISLIVVGMLFLVPVAHGQNPASELLRYGELAYVEVVNLPSTVENKAQVDVLIRVSYDFLVFTRTSLYTPDSAFSAELDVSIDIKEKGGTYVASSDENTIVYTAEYAATNTRSDFVLLKKTFHIDSGKYVFDINLNDQKSTRIKSFSIPLDVAAIAGSSIPVLGSIIPLTQKNEETAILGYGGKLLFSQPVLLGVSSSNVENAVWRLFVDRIGRSGKDRVLDLEIHPSFVLDGYTTAKADGVVQNLKLRESDEAYGLIPVFKLSLDTLDVGEYEFTIAASSGNETDTLVQTVHVFWKDMPLSLYDVTFATELMRYILTEDEHDEMTSGSNDEQQRKLKKFWDKRDPTPQTPYNEQMYEYFRRVDEAYYRFQTTKHINGALTDRGKIFVLYGEPENVERLLIPGEPSEEVWRYPSLEKTFRFVDRERNSNYRLVH